MTVSIIDILSRTFRKAFGLKEEKPQDMVIDVMDVRECSWPSWRSAQSIITLLGLLKVGAGFVRAAAADAPAKCSAQGDIDVVSALLKSWQENEEEAVRIASMEALKKAASDDCDDLLLDGLLDLLENSEG